MKKQIQYPHAIRKWESDCFYIYFNDVDRPIDVKQISWQYYKYDIEKWYDVWDPIEVNSVLD